MMLVPKPLVLLTALWFAMAVVSPGLFAQARPNQDLVLRCVESRRFMDLDNPNRVERFLVMEIENKGTVPLIIINPSLAFGTGLKSVEFYFSTVDKETHRIRTDVNAFSEEVERTDDERSALKSAIEFLHDTEPPQNYTVTLKPNEKFRFEEHFRFVSAKVFMKDNSFRSIQQKAGDADYIRLKYEYPFAKYSSDPDFLDMLQLRWKKFGILALDSDGGYSLASEPIK